MERRDASVRPAGPAPMIAILGVVVDISAMGVYVCLRLLVEAKKDVLEIKV